MDYSILAHSIARIKAMENRLINRAKLDSLIDAKDFSDSIKMIQDTPYGEYVASASYESGLKIALEDVYKNMYKIIPIHEVVDVLAVRYDGHNIKSILKGKLSGLDTSSILVNVGTIPTDSLKHMILEEDYDNIPQTLVKTLQKAVSTFKVSGDPQDIDLIVDKGIFEYAMEIAKDSKDDYLLEYVKFNIDITNIKSFIRIRAQERSIEFLDKVFIDGGKLEYNQFASYINESLERFADKLSYTDFNKWSDQGIAEYIRNGDLGSVDRYGDNYIIEHIKKSKFINLGTEPIIAYIYARENEIKALRIILTGKKSNVHPEKIRERMRDVYV
ncbi:MAG: V-type synthase subunit [Clostridiales bacterium]|jgi:V/A-type H+-transporting ATPase subunit C|nr:V-type synthase subunit [Clostridiales bacterium]